MTFVVQLLLAFVAGYFLGERGKKKKCPKYSWIPPTLNHLSELPAASSGAGAVKTCKENCKLVLCVRSDLKMGKGKIAAQCGHATLGAYQDTLRTNPGYLWKWEADGQPKIALQVSSIQQMKSLEKKAASLGIVAHTVIDAGKTQVAPGSVTVLSLGPAPVSLIDKVTGHLKLL
ncbi:peptidyl-tRNA hydrolase, PTH2 family [Galdieria sulphuraria]|uniref:peptidyl-tRNA hydrolase n=1 Tax=Galdieria sulphuraria TaxID=130081 RepID=M2X9Y4_GALSU|nr:peptidyl-tRNA hydrolase, PTH2 family [Galdieria sulphuraria]EME26687.1 peptidyl-tRNA hydrolase, PTH2 family [Galdieria sulphuraria]|eukprot:XP_005703207.1 peptidyl-tRNA hydrolase, PTH2 family [Galdieria sulphuraria]